MPTTASRPQARDAGMLQGIALVLPITLAVMGVVVLAPDLPQMLAHFRSVPNSDYWVPMILTTPALCVAIFSAPAGYLGDRFGRRRLLIASMVVYSVVGTAPLFLDNLDLILASRVGVGLCEAMLMTLSTTLIGDFFKGEQRDRWLASQTAVASLSALVLLNIGGMLGALGWRGPFLMYASALLMIVGVVFFTWEIGPRDEQPEGTHRQGTRPDFPWARMIGICAVTIFASVMFYVVQIETSVGLTAHGLVDTRQLGWLTSIASLGVPAGTIVFRYVDRMPTAMLLMVEFAILGVGFIAMTHAGSVNGFLLAAGVNQIGAGMILPTLLTWAMRGLAFEVRGQGTGLWTASFSVGQFICPIVITVISRQTGGLLPSFQVLGFACLAACLAALVSAVPAARRTKPVV
ncbi:MAG: MFS transporter [Pseudomonadota bacterium]|nr:MFS transporter [Pseudomonadota bacterium]